jgi:hypothetical protein
MTVLFWVDEFPSFSETFIRDQIIGLRDEQVDVFIYSKGKLNTKAKDALTHFESYNLLDRVVNIDAGFEEHKFKRIYKAVLVLLRNMLSMLILVLMEIVPVCLKKLDYL